MTGSPDNLVNLFEPHLGQMGQARIGSMITYQTSLLNYPTSKNSNSRRFRF